jgi:hypothetical protein
MKNVKVIQLFETFTRREMDEFEKFLEISFFTSERNLQPVFKIIKKYYGDFDNADFTAEKIHSALFKGKKYNDKYIAALISDLYKTAKNFLAYKQLLENKPLHDRFVVEELFNRNLDVEFKRHWKNAMDELDKKYFTSKSYLQNKEELSLIYAKYLDKKKDFDEYASSYLTTMDFSVMASLFKLFHHYGELFNLTARTSYEKEHNLSSFLFNSINYDELQNNLAAVPKPLTTKLRIVYLLAVLNEKESIPLYREAKELFFNNYELFGIDQRREIFIQFFNFCSYMRMSDDSLLNEIFELNKKFLADSGRLYLENNFFDKRVFRNMALCAVELNENEWVINFINEYKKFLEKEAGDNLVNFTLAMVYSKMGEYDKSLDILSQVKFNFGTYKEDISLLKVSVLYEKGYYHEALETLLSFKKTFKKTSQMTKDEYLFFKNSITFFMKFLNIVLKQKYSELDYFEQELNECQIISVKPWLLTKIEELQTKK